MISTGNTKACEPLCTGSPWRVGSGESQLAVARCDLSTDGSFRDQLLVLTDKRLIIGFGVETPPTAELPLAAIVSVRVKSFVGGGCLEIHPNASAPLRFPYTASQSSELLEFVKAIEDAKTGKPVEIKTRDRIRCKKCRRVLPERNGICPSCLRRWHTLRRLAAFLRPHRKGLLVLTSASVVISAAGLIPPLITGRLVDRLLMGAAGPRSTDTYSELALLVLALFLVRLATWGAEWIHGRTVAIVGASVTSEVRRRVYLHLELLSIRFFSKQDTGSLISRVCRDADTLQEFLIRGLPYTFVNAATLIGIVILMFSIYWKLALCIVLTVPAVLFWAFFFWRNMTNFYHRWWQAGARFSSYVNETLSGNRITKMFRQEAAEMKRFRTESGLLRQTNMVTGQRRATFLAAMGLITTAGIAILWSYGGLEVWRGHLSPGSLVALYAYVLLFYGPLQWFGQVSNWMTQAFTGAERIFEILDTPTEAIERPGARRLASLEGCVNIRNLFFGYEKQSPVLKGINLDVRSGEFIGIVGRSGVGKTTLMHLLCRFYDPDQGSIEFDGVDIRDIDLHDLRRKIGIVQQEPFLFRGTIAENIKYGRPEAGLDEVMAAARVASAHEFIVQKQDGYDSLVGENGRWLSQGEKQRIALARCLLCDPRIIILDEATSSVDPISERSIQHATNLLRRNRTTFAIAHRLSTLANADRIIVLENGRIVEVGKYEELITADGAFASLVKLQYRTPEAISIQD